MAALTRPVTIALAGNPNVGKSTLFNALTGSRQHVGNWPGKTVEKKEGQTEIQGLAVSIVDLPGTYSLTAYSIEEVIARDFILQERPDAVVAVVDASNLERNLYLVSQVMELDVPLVVALNMTDIAAKRGWTIDKQQLSRLLGGVPVVETVGTHQVGLDDLKHAIQQCIEHDFPGSMKIDYGELLENEITVLEQAVMAAEFGTANEARWLAIKLLEVDDAVVKSLREQGHDHLLTAAQQAMQRIEAATDEEAETLITDYRYGFIDAVVRESVRRPAFSLATQSDRIDQVLTHRLLGLPIFFLLMWIVFQFTANVSAPMIDWVDGVFSGPVSRWAVALLAVIGLGDTWVENLIVDGIIAGVGGVLTFVPVLLSLYFAIGMLEDSGYMARAAFVMDRVMRVIGLHGKSFIPLLVGFGCTVPAVYATRTLEHESDRRLTGFLATFMSCGARLPVYVLFGTAFLGADAANMVFGMYILGIIVALLTGLALKRAMLNRRPPQPFVLELPPYRVPTMQTVGRQMWERTAGFIRKAGTVILVAAIVIWFMLALPVGRGGSFADVAPENSLFGAISRTIAPVFAPAGFDDWRASGALITGFVGKEIIISTMHQVYASDVEIETAENTNLLGDFGEIGTTFAEAGVFTLQEAVNILPRTLSLLPGINVPDVEFRHQPDPLEDTASLESALRGAFTLPAAIAFNAFVLLYVPCMTAVAAMWHEFRGRWTAYQVTYTLVVAWAVSVLIYQITNMLGIA